MSKIIPKKRLLNCIPEEEPKEQSIHMVPIFFYLQNEHRAVGDYSSGSSSGMQLRSLFFGMILDMVSKFRTFDLVERFDGQKEKRLASHTSQIQDYRRKQRIQSAAPSGSAHCYQLYSIDLYKLPLFNLQNVMQLTQFIKESELCSLSQNMSTTTITRVHDEEVHQRVNRSPMKLPRNRD
ncbi:hypothetical protein GBA52_007627 [Prunus armeniaca]|nr:hypothetical protein GBA52_007627 [Prunus armeniaca]